MNQNLHVSLKRAQLCTGRFSPFGALATQWHFVLGLLGEFELEIPRRFEEQRHEQNPERLFSSSTENKEYWDL